jgi:cytochrome c2
MSGTYTLDQGQFSIAQGSGSAFAQQIFQSCNACHAGASMQVSDVGEAVNNLVNVGVIGNESSQGRS